MHSAPRTTPAPRTSTAPRPTASPASPAAPESSVVLTESRVLTVTEPWALRPVAQRLADDDPQTAATLGYRPPLTDQAALALVCAHLDGAEIAERADELGLRVLASSTLATDRRCGTPLFETEEIHDA